MRGINLTIPHKVAVMPLLDEIAPDAAVIGAVNTVRREGDRLIGENTDGKGFLRGVRQDAGIDPKGKRAVVLGAGGAARAIVTELALAGVSELVVVNRSSERGETDGCRARRQNGRGHPLSPWRGPYKVPGDADLLVNATSIGLYPNVRRHAAGEFQRRATGTAGLRRGVQSARDAPVGAGATARARDARWALDARVSGHDRIRVVDGPNRAGGRHERGAHERVGRLDPLLFILQSANSEHPVFTTRNRQDAADGKACWRGYCIGCWCGRL